MGGKHIKISGGGITETARNDYRMDANDTITNYGGQGVQQNGSKGGVINGKFETIPVGSKCVVEFRPCKDWKGEFGIDWERKSDSHMAVDNAYNGIIGKYGRIYGSEPGAVFTPSNESYKKHLTEYAFFNSYKGKYTVPNMTLIEGETAYLDTITEVLEIPDSMHYEYDTKTFELVILKKLTKSVGKNYDEKAVSIKCIKKFTDNQSIKVIAVKDGKSARVGQINIMANSNLKSVNIIFIPVSHNRVQGAIKGNEITITKNALRQSYIIANIISGGSITAEGRWFNFFFTKMDKGKQLMDSSNVLSIHNYLDGKFFETKENAIYKSYYRVYMLPEGTLNGIAKDVGGVKTVAVFQNRNDSSAPHELMHAMGLYHTFDNDGKYTYKYKNTDNIMDYTHLIGKQRFSTNRWQWKILNPQIS